MILREISSPEPAGNVQNPEYRAKNGESHFSECRKDSDPHIEAYGIAGANPVNGLKKQGEKNKQITKDKCSNFVFPNFWFLDAGIGYF